MEQMVPKLNRIDLPSVRLHYVAAGSGPLVVLLHGFPEFWYSYRNQLPALAAAGFRAVAVDMRGYNLSSKPVGVRAYAMEHLTADVAGLAAALGEREIALVGHDWGAIVAWYAAMRYPDLVRRLVILNVPHPARRPRTPFVALRQFFRSSYVYFFQLPRLPEALIRARDFALLRRTWQRDPVRDDAFTPADIEQYITALKQPGALTAGINYYRAAVRTIPRLAASVRRIETPTLVLWGERDSYLETDLAAPDARWVPNCRVIRLPDASHWVQNDQPERINRLLLDFLA